ncbi:MAG: UDP-N-acetylglucosamine--N-acetylmuramyl-(pentapeptide) pyrophosphoryl-undecaprenol N-acetylglucosamine transferase [SAR324 cluster bacterium]|uniref:UDP-N-acetylglucosamine--N-acetylmuramyl-(pentapeptide) pyrophosphoryl-undecaprenol N-acetylglucosamine transferase n=1 Tax=SAR324 cluster bacterium TaxID=2024889 RepID=A0A7X9FP61_9DELT|nr:UDP-N-acetylglucosamine--N-acetylmuramyl-(pentapeptide) pyrophosphoryl-undecaprenol N-acetylglucosamine transferase [SAR324 cluster bacterium]
MKDEKRVLIAASGSGGHLFPAQFVAKALRRQFPDVSIAFVGSGRPLEEKLIDNEGFKRIVLPLEALRKRNPFTFPFDLLRAFFATWKLFSEFKPDIIIGVGGYVSFFPVLIARLKSIPSIIHEAEIFAGKANRILAFFATKITLAFEETRIPCRAKAVHTGHPLREELCDFPMPKPLTSRGAYKLLIIGGSQGAKGLDEAMSALGSFLRSKGMRVLHQSRQENIAILEKSYLESSIDFQVVSFIDDMRKAYDWADIIISRSGAGAVMELGVVGKPCILVPFPFSQGNHQKTNAMVLVRQGKAILCEEGENFPERLREAISKLLEPKFYETMLLASCDKRSVNAANDIARLAMSLAENRSE